MGNKWDEHELVTKEKYQVIMKLSIEQNEL